MKNSGQVCPHLELVGPCFSQHLSISSSLTRLLSTKTMASDTLRSAGAGAAFGAALTASRVYLPSVIINQMRLQDFHMLEVFLTASAASA